MIFSDGNQRVYLHQKHRIMSFLSQIKPTTKIMIAYHGAAAGEVSALFIIKFLQKKKVKNYILYNFAELKHKQYLEIKSKIKTKKIEKLIILEGFNLPECFAEFNDIAINIDSHFNDKEVITNFLNPVSAKFTPLPATSLVVYDLFKDIIPDKYKWLVAVSSILDHNSQAAQIIIKDEKKNLKNLQEIKHTFWSCQYVEKWGNKIIQTLLKITSPTSFLKEPELAAHKNEFFKKINYHIKLIDKKYTGGPVYYEVANSPLRLTSPLASFLSDIYPDQLIYIVEKFKNQKFVRISVRYQNVDVNLGKTCQKLAKEFKDTDAIGFEDTSSIRTKSNQAQTIFKALSKYC